MAFGAINKFGLNWTKGGTNKAQGRKKQRTGKTEHTF